MNKSFSLALHKKFNCQPPENNKICNRKSRCWHKFHKSFTFLNNFYCCCFYDFSLFYIHNIIIILLSWGLIDLLLITSVFFIVLRFFAALNLAFGFKNQFFLLNQHFSTFQHFLQNNNFRYDKGFQLFSNKHLSFAYNLMDFLQHS